VRLTCDYSASLRHPGYRRRAVVRVEDRQLALSNLDKQLYFDGYTKAEVIHCYTRIARSCCDTWPTAR
jgi:hypothetical protein